MLRIENLTTYYNRIAALQKVSLEVPEGKIVSIIGANGAGKSTLLKAVSGLIPIREGSIIFNGQPINGLPADKIVSLGISQVPEGRQIFSHMTVDDNIQLGAYLYHSKHNRQEIRQTIEMLYQIFPILKQRSKQIAGTLSGGEQQMLAIARAFMSKPRLLLLDEPSMGLAPLVVREILSVIKRFNKSGTTILLVEQNARAALNISHYAFVLETGKMVLEGLAMELLGNPRVKSAYLGG